MKYRFFRYRSLIYQIYHLFVVEKMIFFAKIKNILTNTYEINKKK